MLPVIWITFHHEDCNDDKEDDRWRVTKGQSSTLRWKIRFSFCFLIILLQLIISLLSHSAAPPYLASLRKPSSSLMFRHPSWSELRSSLITSGWRASGITTASPDNRHLAAKNTSLETWTRRKNKVWGKQVHEATRMCSWYDEFFFPSLIFIAFTSSSSRPMHTFFTFIRKEKSDKTKGMLVQRQAVNFFPSPFSLPERHLLRSALMFPRSSLTLNIHVLMLFPSPSLLQCLRRRTWLPVRCTDRIPICHVFGILSGHKLHEERDRFIAQNHQIFYKFCQVWVSMLSPCLLLQSTSRRTLFMDERTDTMQRKWPNEWIGSEVSSVRGLQTKAQVDRTVTRVHDQSHRKWRRTEWRRKQKDCFACLSAKERTGWLPFIRTHSHYDKGSNYSSPWFCFCRSFVLLLALALIPLPAGSTGAGKCHDSLSLLLTQGVCLFPSFCPFVCSSLYFCPSF